MEMRLLDVYFLGSIVDVVAGGGGCDGVWVVGVTGVASIDTDGAVSSRVDETAVLGGNIATGIPDLAEIFLTVDGVMA